MSELGDVQLIDLLPSSISEDEQVKAIAGAIQPELDAITQSIPLIELYSRIDELPEPILRMLAWENRVYRNEWSLAETIESKRELVKNSFELNQRRGTRWSIERVLELLNVDASLQEWFEYGGSPYRFKINLFGINDGDITEDQVTLLNQLINQYKPLRSALESIDSTLTADEVKAYVGTDNSMFGILELYSFEVQMIEETLFAKAATSRSMAITIEVQPDTTP